MGLFEVEKSRFGSLAEFNAYLTEMDSSVFDKELYIVTGLSQYPKNEFYAMLRSDGYSFDDLGVIQRISFIIGEPEDVGEDGETPDTTDYYLHFDDETGVVLFYTDLRKTKEINPYILRFLKNKSGIHYLPVTPHLFRQIREEVSSGEELAEIPEFVADRRKGSDVPSHFRPDVERTFNYYSMTNPDGFETLRELESFYGVRPRYIVFNVPNKSKFKVDREGVFGLLEGDLTILFKYVKRVIQETLSVKDAYSDSDFRLLPSTETLEVPVSTPTAYRLKEELQYAELDQLKSRLQSEDFFVIDTFEQEGSLYFSAKVFDKKKRNKFRIKASENEVRIYPQEEEGNLGSFLRFHEFIQNNLDPQAEVVVEG